MIKICVFKVNIDIVPGRGTAAACTASRQRAESEPGDDEHLNDLMMRMENKES